MSTQTISRVMSSLPVSTQTDVNRTSHVQVPEVSEEEVVVLDGGSPSKQRRMSAERYPLPICKECDKMFKNSSQLGQHMLVHNNIRKHKCTFCEKTFKQLSHLQQHVRMHTGEKPYACKLEGCNKAFAQMANLQHHMRMHEKDGNNVDPSIKPYRCDECFQEFHTQRGVSCHKQKAHTVYFFKDIKKEEQVKEDQLNIVSSSTTKINHTEGNESAKKEQIMVSLSLCNKNQDVSAEQELPPMSQLIKGDKCIPTTVSSTSVELPNIPASDVLSAFQN